MDVQPALTAGGGKPGEGYPAILVDDVRATRELSQSLQGLAVRRLTPRECERLQGFPDDWTADQVDGHRYRQLGNAVCVPVAEWIGRRIVATHARFFEEVAPA